MSERDDYDPQYRQIRRAVVNRDNHECQDCGNSVLSWVHDDHEECPRLHVHHIVPKSKGGSDDPTNLITLCESCHQKRHSRYEKTFDEEENPPEDISKEEYFPYPCPHDDCDMRFRKEVGLRPHYSIVHGEPEDGLYPWQRREIYIWFNCPNCDELAERKLKYSGRHKTFCSNDCYHEYLSDPETPSARELSGSR